MYEFTSNITLGTSLAVLVIIVEGVEALFHRVNRPYTFQSQHSLLIGQSVATRLKVHGSYKVPILTLLYSPKLLEYSLV